MTFLIVDAGNTRIKTALYSEGLRKNTRIFTNNELTSFASYLSEIRFDRSIVSSVVDAKETENILQLLPSSTILLSHNTPIPIEVHYDSRVNLGKDRLANAVAAFQKAKQNAVVIDVGTCIKFDVITAEGNHLGGSISPGLQMRFYAMHKHTRNLPLLNNLSATKLIGNSTVNSMTSGVMNGAKYEIEGMINSYQEKFKDLVIFATGGDVGKLDLNAELPIIYDEHLTLDGLYEILQIQS